MSAIIIRDRCHVDVRTSQFFFSLTGILAERLRLRTKGLFSPQQKIATSPALKPEAATALPPRFHSHPSIESSNTISNSSLQDYDETEFSGTELARYMGELNCDLIA